MGVSYQQKNTIADCGPKDVGGFSPVPSSVGLEMIEGGTNPAPKVVFGTVPNLVTSIILTFETISGVPNLTTWPSGTWTININVSQVSNKITWENAYICKVTPSPACVVTELGSTLLQAISCATAGVKSMDVVISSDLTVLATDQIYIALAFKNNHQAKAKTVGISPDQMIITPIPEAAGNISLVLGSNTAVASAGALTVVADLIDVLTAAVAPVTAGNLVVIADQTITLTSNTAVATAGAVFIYKDLSIQLGSNTAVASAGAVTVSGGSSVFQVWDGGAFVVIGGTQ